MKIFLIILSVIFCYYCVCKSYQILEKLLKFISARRLANKLNKPLLNAGCGGAWHHYLHKFIQERCDINVDLIPRDAPNFISADIQNLHMFTDKKFGVAFCSHTLEHVQAPPLAIRELQRVADIVIIAVPKWWDIFSYFGKNHKWLVLSKKYQVRLRK